MKNYLICVGGSGARILRAVVHMSACGLMPVEELEVVIIDPDKDTKTTALAVQELKDYQEIKRIYTGEKILQPEIKHFAQKKNDSYIISPLMDGITNLKDLCGTEQDMEEVMRWFFKNEEMEQNLEKGFYARPAIGAVFFSNFNNEDFTRLLDNIEDALENQEEVNLLLVGSIFGGTGASGIPTIMKILAEKLQEEYSKGKRLYLNLHTGAIFILPYFTAREAVNRSRNDKNITIQVGDFSSNTKEALHYYDVESYYGEFSPNNFRKFQILYLIGQSKMDEVNDYAVGSAEQKNKAHLVELYAALAVGDFYSRFLTADNKEEKEGIFVYAKNDKMTWRDFPLPYGSKEGAARKTLSLFIRFCCVFTGFIYQSLYNPIEHGKSGVNIYIKEHKLFREQWYYNLIDAKDESLKENMNIVWSYCRDFIDWFYEVNAVRNSNSPLTNKDGLILNERDMALLGGCYELLHQLLCPEKYTINEDTYTKVMERTLDMVYKEFYELITEEENKIIFKRIISELNNSEASGPKSVSLLIDRILEVLQEVYR